jgi:hypothetical protein
LVSNPDAAPQENATVVKLEHRLSGEGSSLQRHPRSTEFFPFARNGQQRTPNASLGLDLARAIAHRTSQKAELFCEIRMMQPVVMIARNAMDAHYCWLLLESPTQLEGTLLERQSCQSPFF